MKKRSPESKIRKFFTRGKPLFYKKGEIILRAGEEPSGVFFLNKGYTRIYSITRDGKEFTLNIFKPGSFFPLTWVIADIENNYFYEAITDVEIFRMPKEEVIKFLKEEKDALFETTRRILVGLSGILILMQHLLHGSVRERICSTFLLLSRRFGVKEGGKVVINLPLTHQDIANIAVTTRETASLQIKNLEKMGILSRQSRLFVVADIERLRRMSIIYFEDKPLPYIF